MKNKDKWHESLCMINCMLVKSLSAKKRAQFLARLENLGLYSELSNLDRTNDTKVNQQLMNMQLNTK